MPSTEEMRSHLAAIPNLTVLPGAPLSRYTRFGIGGPADLYAETEDARASPLRWKRRRRADCPLMVIGDGTNLIVSDAGFRGIVLRYRASSLAAEGNRVTADAGAVLQDLVDFTIARGLKGLETLSGIPGSVGAAIYGNAGAYGHSIAERVTAVTFYDGSAFCARSTTRPCEFHYRESIFKRCKEWIIFSTELVLDSADAAALRRHGRWHSQSAQRKVSRHHEVRRQHLQEPAA